jgi:hypothetical protein
MTDMAASPRFKVYAADGEYRGSLKYVEDAAALVALLGRGATIRDGHRKVVWTEGVDGDAADSYDTVALHVHVRS